MELQELILVTDDIEKDFKAKLAQLCEDFSAKITTAFVGGMHVGIKDLKSHHSGHQPVSFVFPLGAAFDMYQENLNTKS